MYVLIYENKVVQVEEKTFPVAEELKWVEISGAEAVYPGYVYDGGKFIAPLIPTTKIPIDKAHCLIDAVAKFCIGDIDKAELEKEYDLYKTGLKIEEIRIAKQISYNT
jgi:hypothetical protein